MALYSVFLNDILKRLGRYDLRVTPIGPFPLNPLISVWVRVRVQLHFGHIWYQLGLLLRKWVGYIMILWPVFQNFYKKNLLVKLGAAGCAQNFINKRYP